MGVLSGVLKVFPFGALEEDREFLTYTDLDFGAERMMISCALVTLVLWKLVN